MECLPDLIREAAADSPERPALLAPGRDALSYAHLNDLVGSVGARLAERGIGPGDRVALVVENGPAAAAAFLALACAAGCAPLNPAYRSAELDFSLGDLGVRAVVVGSGLDSPVRDVAAARGIEVLELDEPAGAAAGVFDLGGPLGAPAPVLSRDPESTALLQHTSGTTSRPKLVPLSHRNLLASAGNVSATLELRPDDVCLGVMPLFHIHGLVAGLLASLHARAAIACCPGFHPIRVFDWLRDVSPTWVTAVPTMHQSLLARLPEHPDVVSGHRLRFARSSSAALPVPVLHGLEELLGVPVVEAYGMTEAAHQMTCNPLPPGRRSPGSVGPAAGPEVAILDAAGEVLPPGTSGEVAIRGVNVFAGYEENPEANAAAFANGWFRTGDEGFLDGDGYLFLRGRLKELINRGGEKIAPLEVDERLLAHPAVAQAVAFPVEDASLGEEVAAAVVLRVGHEVGEAALQDFVAQTLAPFKVPRRIVFVDEIPQGPTGKVQRLRLAEQLDLAPQAGPTAVPGTGRPRVALERELLRIWSEVLRSPGVGLHDDFFALGGDSILGAEAVARIRDLTGSPELPLVSIVRAPTVAAMARELTGAVSSLSAAGVVPLKQSGSGSPLFFVHGGDGDGIGFVALARRLTADRPLHGIRARGLDGLDDLDTSVAQMAARYVDEVVRVQPGGPYVLGGFCMGGAVAVEMAHLLRARGEAVALLVLVDPRFARPRSLRFAVWHLFYVTRRGRLPGAALERVGLRRRARAGEPPGDEVAFLFEGVREAHRVRASAEPAVVILSRDYLRHRIPRWFMRRVLHGVRRFESIDVLHDDLFRASGADALAAAVDAALAEADRA